MKNWRSLLRHPLVTANLWVTIGGGVVGVVNYAFNILAGRILGPAVFAEVGAALALFYIGSVAAVALSMRITTWASADEQRVWPLRARFVLLGAGVALVGVLIAPLIAVAYRIPASYVALGAVFTGGTLVTAFYTGILQARRLFPLIMLFGLVVALVKLLLGIGGLGVWQSGVVPFLGIQGSLGVGWAFLAWRVRPREDGSAGQAPIVFTTFLRESLPLLAGLTLLNLLFLGETLVAPRYLPAVEAGYVAALSTFGKVGFWVSQGIATVLFAYVNDPQLHPASRRRYLWWTIGGSSLVLLGFVLVTWWGGEWIVPALFGEAYREAVPLVGVALLPLLFFNLLTQLSRYQMRQANWRLPVILLGGVLLQQVLFYFFGRTAAELFLIQAGVFAGVGVWLILGNKSVRRETDGTR